MQKARESKLRPFFARLEEWFLEGETLKFAQEQLALEGCVVSINRLSEWWRGQRARRQEEALLAQIASGAKFCKGVEAEFAANPSPELSLAAATLRTLVMRLCAQGTADPSLLALAERLFRAAIQHEKLELSREQVAISQRRLAIAEARAKQAEKTEAVLKAEMPAEERAARIREIFKR
jgi:hypothetical protein